jgi:3-dehydroquinate synthetase
LEDNTQKILARDLPTMSDVVRRCVQVKARVVALDERESGIRAHLNLGHTIGHALESSGGFTALTHGEAVSLGLVAALRLGEKLGHTPATLTARILTLLQRLNLPHRLDRSALEKSTTLLSHDKKRSGDSIRFVFAAGAGQLFTEAMKIKDLVASSPGLADT